MFEVSWVWAYTVSSVTSKSNQAVGLYELSVGDDPNQAAGLCGSRALMPRPRNPVPRSWAGITIIDEGRGACYVVSELGV
jgi:hypothetical protein